MSRLTWDDNRRSVWCLREKLVGERGFEPPTPGAEPETRDLKTQRGWTLKNTRQQDDGAENDTSITTFLLLWIVSKS